MFSIVVPIYNEEKNIENLINEILNSLKNYSNYEIILVNDCSIDGSLEKINTLNKKKIVIINNPKNLGQSFSIHKGVQSACFETIVTIDGDGQNNPRDIPVLLKLFNSDKKISMVGGIRKKRKDNFIKIISSKIANLVRSTILNDDCVDTGCSLKVFKRDIFLQFPYFDGIHRFLPALFKGYGYKTFFIKVDHRQRKYGSSKYGTINRLFKGIYDMIKVMNIIKNKK